MPWLGFEPTIQPFKRAKTGHALDRAATVIGSKKCMLVKLLVTSLQILVRMTKFNYVTYTRIRLVKNKCTYW
jgi:hypothetical protein